MDPNQILTQAVKTAQSHLKTRLQAAYALGSLAHGGFAPDVSDLDLALITTATPAEIAEIRAETIATVNTPLAERLSLFHADWNSLTTGEIDGRFPATDRVDLIRHGRLLYGTDHRETCAVPTHEDLIADSRTFAQRFHTEEYRRKIADVDSLLAQGKRAVTKAVLFPVRISYTVATGELGQNAEAAHWHQQQNRPHAELVRAALTWRTEEITDDARELLTGLPQLYDLMFADLSS